MLDKWNKLGWSELDWCESKHGRG